MEGDTQLLEVTRDLSVTEGVATGDTFDTSEMLLLTFCVQV